MKRSGNKFRRSFALILALALMAGALNGCGMIGKGNEPEGWRAKEVTVIDDNYRTWYEIFVYSFCDSDGDGIGDLQGVV